MSSSKTKELDWVTNVQFVPLNHMWMRVRTAREDSDSLYLDTLLYTGEMILKLTCAALTSVLVEDTKRAKYRVEHGLVRATGLGPWIEAIDEILVGSTASLRRPEAGVACKQLTESCSVGRWQYEVVENIHACLGVLEGTGDGLGGQVVCRAWFSLFRRLRNKTRGHGAISSTTRARLVPYLQRSIQLLTERMDIWQWSWAYLHQNLSGKYRVTPLCPQTTPFETLRSCAPSDTEHLPDGVYLCPGGNSRCRVEMVHSDVDSLDFLFPNGGFREEGYEVISYITGNTELREGVRYRYPATQLPKSETHGLRELDAIGQCFSNMPPPPSSYVDRPQEEQELCESELPPIFRQLAG